MNAGSESVPLKCAIGTHRRKNAIDAPRVLVVDDFIDTADAISMVLDFSGFDTNAVYGGQPAIDATRRWQSQIVLLDIWMPDMSGLEVAARLRANEKTSETMLIAHSAAAGERDLERAKQAGFDAFCAKPTDAAALGPLVRYFVPEPVATV
ncbi:response regulator [Caballeronia sp. Lep1P3]|uniref:response regulator n=1 Tax=Caballeronia sp. Lep1P3 TaxID=2878150 RepID=UPI001FD04B3A|nr:response regulator [Caballeronia sp. Lep1P3]